MNSSKILIVENNKKIASDIKEKVTSFGYSITNTLYSNDECITEIINNQPDLILLDSKLNDWENGSKISDKITETFKIPVIKLIGNKELLKLGKNTEIEPAEYLTKPVNENDLYINIQMSLYKLKVDSKLKESEGIYRTIFETTGNATIIIEKDTSISLANKEFELLSGYSREEIVNNKSWTEFILEEDLDKMLEYHRLRRIDSTAAPRNYDFRFIDKYGNQKEIYMTVDIIPGTKKSVASYMNVSEQKRLQSEIIRVSEQERRQIGNDLHDGLGPHLVGINFMTNLLKQKLIAKSANEEAKNIDEINELISQAIEHIRQLVKGLSPVDIDANGLIFAVEDLTSNVEKVYSISCKFTHKSSISIHDNITAIHLFLITQEAVNNSIKHSKAKNIDVNMIENNDVITLMIKDDGIGIEKLLDKKKGVGINIMKYRARIINASLNIGQNDTGGTSVTCIFRNR